MRKINHFKSTLLLLTISFAFISGCSSSKSSSPASAVTATPTPTPTPTPSTTQTSYSFFVTHESVGIYKLTLDFNSNTVSQSISASINTVLGSSFVNANNRGLSIGPTGDIYVTHFNYLGVGILTDTLAASGSGSFALGSGHGMTGVYGVCHLPNGNIIIGADQWSGKKAAEFSSTGTFLRAFNSTQVWSFSDCKAISNTKVVWVDYDGGTDTNGDVVMSEFNGTSWSETGRFVTNTSLPTKLSSMFYSVAVHTNGNIYAFPYVGGSTSDNRVLKCSTAGTLTDCSPVGSPIDTQQASIHVIQGAHQLTGRDDIVFIADDRKIYLFNATSNAITLFADASSLVAALTSGTELRASGIK